MFQIKKLLKEHVEAAHEAAAYSPTMTIIVMAFLVAILIVVGVEWSRRDTNNVLLNAFAFALCVAIIVVPFYNAFSDAANKARQEREITWYMYVQECKAEDKLHKAMSEMQWVEVDFTDSKLTTAEIRKTQQWKTARNAVINGTHFGDKEAVRAFLDGDSSSNQFKAGREYFNAAKKLYYAKLTDNVRSIH